MDPRQNITVGKVSVPLEKAKKWVRDYTNSANVSSKKPYAYPAYDEYESDNNDPWRLSDADLLAPGLLNVPVKIRSYYGLQGIRRQLENALARIDLDLELSEVDDPARISALVEPFYTLLDDPDTKPWNVKGTTLSKILHRKRPRFLVLHDIWVNACYVGASSPVPRAKHRSWAEYMSLVTNAIADDIRRQRAALDVLDASASTPGALTHVRLLDIVAWTSKGAPASEAS